MTTPDTIVLVSIDDLRYDCVGAAESRAWLEQYDVADAVDTPTLDEVVGSGRSYDRATSTSSYTPPSHASIFTGQYPSEHGVKTFFNRLDDSHTLARALSDAGYETVAWIENVALDMLDVTAGFDTVVCPFEREDANLFEFVRSASDADKLFLFVHLFDVHKPYGYATGGTERERYNGDYPECLDPLLPAELRASEMVEDAREEASDVVPNYDDLTPSLREYADYRSLDHLLRNRLEELQGQDRFETLLGLYVEGVNRFDRRRLADLLDVLDETGLRDGLFLLTSDHGETRCRWGDREDLMNSFNVSEGAVRVPLVVEPAGGSVDDFASASAPVSHVDVLPTLLDVADASTPRPTSGRSLREDLQSDRPLFNESWYYSGGADFFGNVEETGEGGLSEAAVRIGDCKLVRSFAESGTPDSVVRLLSAPIPERTSDPEACEPPEELEAELDGHLQSVDTSCTPDVGGEQSKMEDRLKALGYLE